MNWIPDEVMAVLSSLPVRIAFLVILAVVIRAIVGRMINGAFRRAAASRSTFGGSRQSQRREQRIKALGSMAGSIASVLIMVIFASIVLSELGFNITGLLTGTTIVAATLAFGMQNVIKDLIAGVSMLIEDQVGVGDYVDLEHASGIVQRVGLRTTTVRDDNHNLWYVRNGEVDRVGNFSQGGSGRPIPTPQPLQPIQIVTPETERDSGS